MSKFNIGINVDPANNPFELLSGLKYTSALQFDVSGNGTIVGDLSVNTLNYVNLNPGITAGAQGDQGFDGNSSIWEANSVSTTPTTGLFHINPTGTTINTSCEDFNGVMMDDWFGYANVNDIITVREVNNPVNVGYFRLTSTFSQIPIPAPAGTCSASISYMSGSITGPVPATVGLSYYIGYVVSGATGTSGVDGTNGVDGNDGIDGTNGLAGADGTNGTNGIDGVDGNDGAQGNNFAYSTISFTLRLLKDDSGLSVIPQMLSFNMPVNGIGGAWFGWPILPHGAGSSFSNYGSYMGSNSGVAFASDGMNYGEYMPQKGAIYGAAVNWAINSITTLQYKIYAVNYGPSNPFFPGMEITASAPHGIPTAVPGGYLRGSNSVWGDKVPFAAGDYIGIYIVPADPLGGSGAQIKDPIEIEGTLYFRFDNVDKSNSASPEKTW